MRHHLSRTFALLAVILLLTLFAGSAQAYDRYSINDDATNCHFCHGDFRASSYTGRSDGQSWGNLPNLHRQTMVSGDCNTCHLPTDNFPVMLNTSAGGSGLAAIGCIGCHGRAEDGTGVGTEGYGLAIQRRHEAANVGAIKTVTLALPAIPERPAERPSVSTSSPFTMPTPEPATRTSPTIRAIPLRA